MMKRVLSLTLSLRSAFIVVILCVAGVLWKQGFQVHDLAGWIKSQGAWGPALYVIICVGLMSVMVPKTAISMSAGALFGTAMGSLLLLWIAVIAASTNYLLGRWYFGKSFLTRRLTSTRIDREGADVASSEDTPESETTKTWLQAIEQLAAEAGFGFHLLVRISPIPTMVISYCMGAARARWKPYLAAAAVAVIPQVLWIHGASMAVAASMVDDAGPASSDLPTRARYAAAGVSFALAAIVFLILPRFTYKRLQQIRSRQVVTSDDDPFSE